MRIDFYKGNYYLILLSLNLNKILFQIDHLIHIEYILIYYFRYTKIYKKIKIVNLIKYYEEQ